MTDEVRSQWFKLAELLNSREFDVINAWLESPEGDVSAVNVNHVLSANAIPSSITHVRVVAEFWVRGDDKITEDVGVMLEKLGAYPQYAGTIVDGDLIIRINED